jgi:hypothetical protein
MRRAIVSIAILLHLRIILSMFRKWLLYLLRIMNLITLLDYVSSAPDPQLFVFQNTDLPIPELDSIGMQSIPLSMFSNSDQEIQPAISNPEFTMGYLPRYYSWKTSYDYVLGSFTTTEKEWIAPITPSIWFNMLSTVVASQPSFTYNFLNVHQYKENLSYR